LRYLKLYLAIGWLLVLLVCYFSLTSSPPKIDIQFKYLDKLGHLFSYFILMTWFAQLYPKNKTRIYYALFFISLGVLLEVLQGLGGVRFFEYADMVANTTGVIIAFILARGKLGKLLATIESRYI
jgi:VanZ family protein